MGDTLYVASVMVHVIFVVIAVGTVTVVDYLHLVGLRRKKIEGKLVMVYPLLSRMINYALIGIYLSGAFLLWQNPALLASAFFLTKMALVVVVTANGLMLQHSVGPEIDRCILKGEKYCTHHVLLHSVIGGSISIVTWYGILILAMTKNEGYSIGQLVLAYLAVLFFAMGVGYVFEKRSRKWRE